MSEPSKKNYVLTIPIDELKDVARYIAVWAFRRGGELEKFHQGIVPSTKTGDYSDVEVVSPFGTIPWNEVSRISGPEIRKLMLNVEDVIEKTLQLLMVSDKEQRDWYFNHPMVANPSYNDPIYDKDNKRNDA